MRDLLPLAAVLFVARPAAAAAPAPCRDVERPWVRLEGGGGKLADALATELRGEDIDVCRDGPGTAPIATVSIASSGVHFAIEVRDAVTAKRVARDVDLGTIPVDGRDLTLALATDELLRASWAELTLAKAPPPSTPLPIAVERAVTHSLRADAVAKPPLGSIGVVFAGEAFVGGQAQWGVDARLRWLATPRLSTTVRFGLRATLPNETAEGEVRGSTVLAGIGPAYRVLQSEHVGLELFARLDVADVTYDATTTIRATASSGSALAVLASAGAALEWRPRSSFFVDVEAGAAAPLRPVRATEGGTQVIVGMSGVGGLFGLGMGALF